MTSLMCHLSGCHSPDAEVDDLVAVCRLALLGLSLAREGPRVITIATGLRRFSVGEVRSRPGAAWRAQDHQVVEAILDVCDVILLFVLGPRAVGFSSNQDVDLLNG